MENKKNVERLEKDIKILENMIRRHQRMIRGIAKSEMTTGTVMHQEALSNLKRAKRWLKTRKEWKGKGKE